MSDDNIEDALQPDTFNFLDVLAERSFPKDTVSIYLNDAAAYQAQLVREVMSTETDTKKLAEAEKLLKKYIKEVKESEYKFHLSGVPLEKLESLFEIAKEKFPIETKTRKTASGGLEQYEVQSQERNEYIGYLSLWVHVQAIEAPDGKIQAAPDVDTIIAFIKNAPQSQVQRFSEAITKLQVNAKSFEEAIDDDFLAKS